MPRLASIFTVRSITVRVRKPRKSKREELIDAAAMFSDELTEAALEEEEIAPELLLSAVRQGTLARRLTPVYMGAAYKNKGVQPLLDAIVHLLPCPLDVENQAFDTQNEETPVILQTDSQKAPVALAFKVEDRSYGQLTYIRVYQGRIRKGDTIINLRTGKKIKVGRVVRMHADQMEDIAEIAAGYIGALFGIDSTSGDTLVSRGTQNRLVIL